MSQHFKLYPKQLTTDTKIFIINDTHQRESTQLTILGWRRIMPNKITVPVQCRDPMAYQCSPLDNGCVIEVSISYKLHEKTVSRCLVSGVVGLSRELRDRAMYGGDTLQCRVSVDQFGLPMTVSVNVLKKRIKIVGESGKFQTSINQNVIEIQPIHFTLRQSPNKSNQQTKHLGIGLGSGMGPGMGQSNNTPRNGKSRQLKNDGSSSSLRSNNKSANKGRTKTQHNLNININSSGGFKDKIRITEQIYLKKSCSKVNSNSSSSANTNVNNSKNNINLNLTSTRECLNIFQQDNQLYQKEEGLPSTAKQSDLSMDLRGSFEELDKMANGQKEDDNISNHSFKQKNKPKLGPIDEQNKRLRQQNARLKRQLQTLQKSASQAATLKKQYINALKQLQRIESQRIALVKDKVKYQSAFYEQQQQKQKLRRQLQKFIGPMQKYNR